MLHQSQLFILNLLWAMQYAIWPRWSTIRNLAGSIPVTTSLNHARTSIRLSWVSGTVKRWSLDTTSYRFSVARWSHASVSVQSAVPFSNHFEAHMSPRTLNLQTFQRLDISLLVDQITDVQQLLSNVVVKHWLEHYTSFRYNVFSYSTVQISVIFVPLLDKPFSPVSFVDHY